MKTQILKYIGQMIADSLMSSLEKSFEIEDIKSFDRTFQMATKLNAYFVTYYDIYLD